MYCTLSITQQHVHVLIHTTCIQYNYNNTLLLLLYNNTLLLLLLLYNNTLYMYMYECVQFHYFAVILIIPDGSTSGVSCVIIEEGNKYSSSSCKTSRSEQLFLSIPIHVHVHVRNIRHLQYIV